MRTMLAAATLLLALPALAAPPAGWEREWPDTDFSQTSIDFAEVFSGGPPKDGIPAIDNPRFAPVAEDAALAANAPVISIEVNGTARAYPVEILMWHEIVNDTVGGVPLTITYCPLCNSAIVFERTVDGQVLDFGTTGKLRHSDLVMYDRQTESWWQQFIGEAVVGTLTGTTLTTVPSRMEPWSAFATRHPDGEVLTAPRMARAYGRNPYAGYDSAAWPFLYRGDYDGPVPPLAYVVQVGERAWPLALIRERGTVRDGTLEITWHPGKAAPLDAATVSGGRDVGYVTVTRDGRPAPYHTPFAFAFKAFHPDGKIIEN